MLCYVTLCYAMLCYAMLCYAMLCYAMLCYAMLCYAMLCYGMICYMILFYITSVCTLASNVGMMYRPWAQSRYCVYTLNLQAGRLCTGRWRKPSTTTSSVTLAPPACSSRLSLVHCPCAARELRGGSNVHFETVDHRGDRPLTNALGRWHAEPDWSVIYLRAFACEAGGTLRTIDLRRQRRLRLGEAAKTTR